MGITVTDMFCGAGGSSTGAVLAGAAVRLAMNHWKRAIETHNTNHPNTDHALADISQADPRYYPRTDILIASPECTNHSLGKGCKRKNQGYLTLWNDKPDPAEERSRCTMFDPLRWAECHSYQMVILENVVDARYWVMWDAWLHAWQSLGYDHEIVYLNSMFAHPTPQSRDRMYFVAWKRGQRKPDLTIRPLASCAKCAQDVESVQSWKPGRHAGKYRQQYVYCCPSCADIIEPHYYPAASAIDWMLPIQRIGDRSRSLSSNTMKRVERGLTTLKLRSPFLIHSGHDVPTGHIFPVDGALPTQTARADLALVSSPAWLMSYYNNGAFEPVTEPVSTVTTLERHALVTSPDDRPRVEDCGFRMLEPHEIQAAMAFPKEYVVTGNRREKVKQLGNAVTPPVMQMLVKRCLASLGGVA